MTNNNTKPSKRTFLRIAPLQSKIFYLSVTFFAVPVITFFVMSGLFSDYIPAFSAIAALIFALLVILCINDKKNIKGALTVGILITAAFISSFVTYTNGYRNAKSFTESVKNTVHRFSGHVVKEDSRTSGSVFVEISEMDGVRLDIPVTVQGFNYTGHYLDTGTYLEFDGKLRMSEDKESVYVEWLKSKGIHVSIYSMRNPTLDADKDKTSVASGIKRYFRGRLLDIFGSITSKSRFVRAFSVGCAMMFGDKSELDSELKDDFSRSGVIHILCVSGLHFSVMLGGLAVVLRYTVKNRNIKGILLFCCAFLYLFMCGFTRSALRAAVMAFVAAMGVSGKSRRYCTYSLMFAVCVICIADPDAVFDSGFRMSCICCTGILCSSLLSEAVYKRFVFHPVVCCVISSFLVSLSASAFLFPYSLIAFDGVSCVAVIASSVTVLPAQLFLILCWLGAIASVMGLDIVNTVFSGVLSAIADYICGAARFFSGLKYAYIEYEVQDYSFLVFMIIIAVAALVTGSKSRAVSVYLYIVSASVLATALLFAAEM